MGNKRLLVLTSTFPRWEGDHEPPFVLELSRRLANTFDVHILAPHACGLAREEIRDQLKIHRFQYAPAHMETLAYEGGMLHRLRQNRLRYLLVPFFLLAQYLAAITLIRKHNIDLIHAHWLVPQGIVAALIKSTLPNAPEILCTSHGGDLFSLRGWLFTALKKWVINKSDHISVVSEAMKQYLIQMDISPEKITVAPMGVDLQSRFIPDKKQRRQNTLVFAGRLVEKKGLIHLIEALPAVLEHYPDLTLRIAGDGPEEASLRSRATKLQLDATIKFLGPIKNEDLPAIYQSGAIAVFPFIISPSGDQEGLGLVMIEALGCGCTLIASDLPAVKDVILDGKTGRLVTPGDTDNIATAITELLGNRDLCKSLAHEGRKYVINKFDWIIVTNNYRRLFNTLLQPPKA
ncbi:Glycosyltransferase [hydrothermal vent metagenome]|uniref:Glycosyltransferase n=1 Tax=hydrothermal vent metagenome TaxID=652676 RepID=A0A3B1BJW1_9ZZZZ